jgi:hypothetical protein
MKNTGEIITETIAEIKNLIWASACVPQMACAVHKILSVSSICIFPSQSNVLL